MRVVFMGTPDFAVPTLEALVTQGHDVAAVYTQPDRPQGRKMVLTPPPVKVAAEAHGIPVHQPTKMRDGTVAAQLRDYSPDVIVVVAYGRILPPDILKIPPLGCVNVHASLLPLYRGAAPIQWAVIDGRSHTGVTTMLMAEGLDTGDMLLREQVAIGEDETAGELFERLAPIGASCLINTLAALGAGGIVPQPQNEAEATHAPILTKEMGRLSFITKTAAELHNQVRGMQPWPVAYALLGGKALKFYRTQPLATPLAPPGEVLVRGNELFIGCKGSALKVLELQLEGSRRMTAAEFLPGRQLASGIYFG